MELFPSKQIDLVTRQFVRLYVTTQTGKQFIATIERTVQNLSAQIADAYALAVGEGNEELIMHSYQVKNIKHNGFQVIISKQMSVGHVLDDMSHITCDIFDVNKKINVKIEHQQNKKRKNKNEKALNKLEINNLPDISPPRTLQKESTKIPPQTHIPPKTNAETKRIEKNKYKQQHLQQLEEKQQKLLEQQYQQQQQQEVISEQQKTSDVGKVSNSDQATKMDTKGKEVQAENLIPQELAQPSQKKKKGENINDKSDIQIDKLKDQTKPQSQQQQQEQKQQPQTQDQKSQQQQQDQKQQQKSKPVQILTSQQPTQQQSQKEKQQPKAQKQIQKIQKNALQMSESESEEEQNLKPNKPFKKIIQQKKENRKKNSIDFDQNLFEDL